MDTAFVAYGHGYEQSSNGRCTAFDGYKILAEPLGDFGEASRKSRSFPSRNGGAGVTYSSHAIKLAQKERTPDSEVYILMHHGGGREVLRVKMIYDNGDSLAALLALPERVLYGVLYSIWQTAASARDEAKAQTSRHWEKAYLEGRIRKQRAKGGRPTLAYVIDRKDKSESSP